MCVCLSRVCVCVCLSRVCVFKSCVFKLCVCVCLSRVCVCLSRVCVCLSRVCVCLSHNYAATSGPAVHHPPPPRPLTCSTLTLRMFLITAYFCVSMKLSSMTRMAMSTSSPCTYSLRCMRALASAILMIDSTCRTVMGILPVRCMKGHTEGMRDNKRDNRKVRVRCVEWLERKVDRYEKGDGK